MKKINLSKVMIILLTIIIIGSIISMFFIPEIFNLVNKVEIEPFEKQSLFYKLVVYFFCFMSIFVLYNATIIFKLVDKKNPFTKNVVKKISNMAITFFTMTILVTIKLLLMPTLITLAVAGICFLASISFFILAKVVKEGISYKEETDYMV